MRSEIINFLSQNRDYYYFLRENPLWHRRLSRNPEVLGAFIEAYKVGRRKRLVDRVEDIKMMANIISAMPPLD